MVLDNWIHVTALQKLCRGTPFPKATMLYVEWTVMAQSGDWWARSQAWRIMAMIHLARLCLETVSSASSHCRQKADLSIWRTKSYQHRQRMGPYKYGICRAHCEWSRIWAQNRKDDGLRKAIRDYLYIKRGKFLSENHVVHIHMSLWRGKWSARKKYLLSKG